jgi:hypothetical protein
VTDPYSVPIVPGSAEPPSLSQLMPESPKPKRPVWPILLGVAALVVIAALSATVFVLVARDSPGTPAAGDTITRPAPAAPAVEAPPAKIWPEPLAANIKLTVKVLKKECFGSAGCLVTYTIEPEYSGSALEPGKVWDITYEVSGAEDPIVNTLELEGMAEGYRYRTEREESTQTPRSSSVLTAKVTAVSPH